MNDPMTISKMVKEVQASLGLHMEIEERIIDPVVEREIGAR